MLFQVLFIVQIFFSFVIGFYFMNQLKSQNNSKSTVNRDSMLEYDKLKRLREICLTEPLSEKTRPKSIAEIVGQEEGIKALRAALCSPNPQHVIIYGPPGVGKTAAARVILEEAKKSICSPFREGAKFIEMDATTLRFDERNIADPLIGSVHDPIYQGAGAYGQAGIPQPKPGAVTKAHGGVLFIDESGELHPIQLNKLLKVLEDRKVFFESAYYSSNDRNIPIHIHDMFKNGLPADFRLVGATTKNPDDLPPAIRSRCIEIYFRPLTEKEVIIIVENAGRSAGFLLEETVIKFIAQYAQNGRDAINVLQTACGLASVENKNQVTLSDAEWVINVGKYSPRMEKKISLSERVGFVNGLAVMGKSHGTVMDIEATATKAPKGKGKLTVTGIIEHEEIGTGGQKLSRTSTARASVQNMLTVMYANCEVSPFDYDIHVNFPGGMPVDGPSAGIAIVTAVYSALTGQLIPGGLAMTGEISIHGYVKPVGGVASKIEAAIAAGVKRVLIPIDNDQVRFHEMGIDVIPVNDIGDVLSHVFNEPMLKIEPSKSSEMVSVLTASPAI